MARGRLNSSAKLQTFSVCTSTPATPSTITSAASAATSEALVSLIKILKPGVSIRLIFFLAHSAKASAGGDGDLALDLFVVEIGDGVAFIDARQAVGGAGGVKKPGGQGRFAASDRGRSGQCFGCLYLRILSLGFTPGGMSKPDLITIK